MAESKPNILLVSTSDRLGGAEQIALSLLNGYIKRIAMWTKEITDGQMIEWTR